MFPVKTALSETKFTVKGKSEKKVQKIRKMGLLNSYSHSILSPAHGATAPSGPGPPHYRGFKITLRHNTLGRTPLYE